MELRDLDRMLRAIPGARTERRTVLGVFEREIAWLIDAHRARSPAAAILVRHAGDASVLDAPLDDERARNAIAKFHWFVSYDDAMKRAGEIVDPRFEAAADAIVDGDAETIGAPWRVIPTSLVRALPMLITRRFSNTSRRTGSSRVASGSRRRTPSRWRAS
jgi:hypothetical protein